MKKVLHTDYLRVINGTRKHSQTGKSSNLAGFIPFLTPSTLVFFDCRSHHSQGLGTRLSDHHKEINIVNYEQNHFHCTTTQRSYIAKNHLLTINGPVVSVTFKWCIPSDQHYWGHLHYGRQCRDLQSSFTMANTRKIGLQTFRSLDLLQKVFRSQELLKCFRTPIYLL